jgi:NADH-quinone oxidoreductase subunit L
MVMALGVGAWTAATFHLFTHAFFKAGLFLGSGSVAHAVHSFDMKKDMGGMRRFMPRTFLTFVICSMALAGIFPLSGFWSKDEILAGAAGTGGLSAYPAMLVMGIIGSALTAAYMVRCIYLTFFGEPRGHAADAAHPPHESGPRILVPVYILTGLAVITGLANFPFGGSSVELRFEHFVEPVAPYFPSEALNDFSHPEFTPWIAVVASLITLTAIGLAYVYWFQGRFHGATARSRVARAGETLLVNKYYFDHLYTGVIADGVKGPIARASYWFNQNVIDGIVNGAGWIAVKSADVLYGRVDQGLVDGVINGSGIGAIESGGLLRRIQTGKVQQYGALLFGGAVILAGIFIFAV